MKFLDLLGKQMLFFDGAMGTMLQDAGLRPGEQPDTWSITHPDVVRDIHAAYLEAGCNILTTNTFGCNAAKLEGSGFSAADVAHEATQLAREAITRDTGTQPKFVALDIGPTGRLLQPLGDLTFEGAVSMFAEPVRAGAAAGADIILIETMNDTYELKAAVLAAKENADLPILATVVMDTHGKMLTGGDLDSVVALLEGLRVDALGLNCGLGPSQMMHLLEHLREITSLPIVLNPNAGMPREKDGKTLYDVGPEEFAWTMQRAAMNGAHVLGGCCGTTPKHIEALISFCSDVPPRPILPKTLTVVSSYGRAIYFTGVPVRIGERINPTGKPRLKQALREGNMEYVLGEGLSQQQAGAQVLDVNAGLPELDEAALLKTMVQQLQSVTDLPLQIDTADSAALAGALRVYNGKPMVNSVNGRQDNLDDVLPLVQKYGGLLVALTLDERGIPETVEGRVEIARRILTEAAKYGIPQKDIIIDTLTMTISSGQENARVTLEALRRVREELGANTILGVSNVSFGLPRRELLNAAFFTLAVGAGLGAAILNPLDESIMNAYYAAIALQGYDPQCGGYILRFGEQATSQPPAPSQATLQDAVKLGLRSQARALATEALQVQAPLAIINESLVPALNEVGQAFEAGKLFLPQLLMSAEAAKAAFEIVRAGMGEAAGKPKGCVVIATVEGDVHDIGKNIVKALLENYQFAVVDLGRDVPAEKIVEAAIAHKTKLVGLSALMTTTMAAMQRTIALLREQAPDCLVMVGGAVLTEPYAKSIGADYYAKDAMSSVRYAQQVYS